MDSLQKAIAILHSAEMDLRSLIEIAINERRYADVARLAEIAQSLEKTISQTNSDGAAHGLVISSSSKGRPLNSNFQEAVIGSPDVNSPTKPAKRQGLMKFPKFETERDRLIKIGWSKKDKIPYEHRAAKDLVRTVSLHLAEVPDKDLFKMDDLLPIRLDDDSEVPSYQAYLVLAWLRYIGLIDKQGKDGYQWVAKSFDEQAFDSAWKSTTSRT